MYLTQKAQKVIKWIAYSIEVLMLVTILALGVNVSKKNIMLKNQKAQIKALTEQVDSLNRVNHALGSETVYTVNCTIQLNSKNIMGVNTINSNNIAKTVATTTRQELLDLRDSMNTKMNVNKPTK